MMFSEGWLRELVKSLPAACQLVAEFCAFIITVTAAAVNITAPYKIAPFFPSNFVFTRFFPRAKYRSLTARILADAG